METLVQYIHNGISLLYLLASAYVIVLSYLRWKSGAAWQKSLYYWSLIVLITMYLQLAQGVYLFLAQRYFNTGAALDKPSDLRFWPVEHFFLMLFALLTAQLGVVIVVNSKKPQTQHKLLLGYFTISLIMVLVSLAMILDFSQH
ncbi:MAG: hypothetical protein RIS47_1502 [Bacteroidota bacterium]|jgi:hypothetical protein